MRLAGVDLNLLVALDALLAESSVTGAARRVGVSQPAMSHSLSRLRDLLDDPLLVRAPDGMIPTARAQALAGPLRQILENVEQALAPTRPFDARTSTASFALSLEEPGQIGTLPILLGILRREAPDVRLEVSPRAEGQQWDALRRGRIDLAFAVDPRPQPDFHQQPVFRLPYVCLIRRDHPEVRRRLSLERFASLRHIAVSRPGIAEPEIERALARAGLLRRVAVRVPSLLPAPWLVASSDLVATVPMPVRGTSGLAVRALKPPIELAPLEVSLVWHERTQREPAHAWFRSVVARACALTAQRSREV
jgi:DNA-binding transcriptional LysR family regulator